MTCLLGCNYRDAIENKLTRHVWTSKKPKKNSNAIPEEFHGFELIDRHHILAFSSTNFVAIQRQTLSFFSQEVKKFQAPLLDNLPPYFDVNFNIIVSCYS